MNVRKPVDYSAMFEALDTLMTADLPQMELYCEIGRLVSGRRSKGAAIAAAEYLCAAYPDASGFSPRNLRRMREFYRAYQKISDTLNGGDIPFSEEAPLWNKHKVKRLLENPRYTGVNEYPPIIDQETFDTIQSMIRGKTVNRTKIEKRPAQRLKEYLRCGDCHGRLLGMGGKNQRCDTLYLRCEHCGILVTISDNDLLAEVGRQITEHNTPPDEPYTPSSEVVRLTNTINRELEHPDKPEDVVALVLQGVSARYDCCSAPTEYDTPSRLTEVDFKHFGRAVSHIVIAEDSSVTIQFK